MKIGESLYLISLVPPEVKIDSSYIWPTRCGIGSFIYLYQSFYSNMFNLLCETVCFFSGLIFITNSQKKTDATKGLIVNIIVQDV